MNYDTLNSLVSQGLSSHKIAKRLNYSQSNIRHWLKKFNLKTKHNQFQKTERTEKPCSKCKVIFPMGEFYGKGKGTYSYCKKCANEDAVIRLRGYKIQSVEYKGGKCQICGYNKHFGALEFHHLDPSKKDILASGSNRSFEALKPELDKCALVCANCHREVHAGIVTL